MNRPTRKIISLMLVLCLLLTFAGTTTAFAAEPELFTAEVPEAPIEQPEATDEPTAEEPSTTPEGNTPPSDEPTVVPDNKVEIAPPAADLTIDEEIAQPESAAQTAEIKGIEELIAIAQQDGAQAATLLNAYSDDAAYLDALSKILDMYYENGLTDQLAAFSAALDSRAADTLAGYAAAAAERASGNLGFVPGEVLVVFNKNISEPQASESMVGHAAELASIVETPAEEVVAVVDIALDQTVAQAVEEITSDPTVEYAQPNYLYDFAENSASPDSLPNDPEIAKQWHLNKINMSEALDIVSSVNGTRVKVAVLDKTPDLTHEDLASNTLPSQSYDMQTGTAQPYPAVSASHGTHVAGIIGAVTNNNKGIAGVGSGMNNEALDIVAYNVFRDSDRRAPTTAIIPAINHAVNAGARVINMSLSYTSTLNPSDKLFEDAVNNAYNKGTVVVAAAGNENSEALTYPSDFENCISVINTLDYTSEASNSKVVSSNYGDKKDISAPGNGIYSTYPNNTYSNSSGTSMAAPIVAGVAALMLYVNPRLTPAQVKDIITGTATDLYTPGFDIYTAWGNVNAYRAVAKAAGKTLPTTPQNFKVEAQGTTSAKLGWNAVSGVDGYNIYRSDSESGTYSLIRANTSASQTSFTNTGLETGKKYFYKVASYVGTSNQLESVPAGPLSAVASLPAPANFKATKIANQESVALSWDSVSGATGYEIYRFDNETSGYSMINKVTSANYSDTTVISGRTYFYKVNAYLTSGGTDISGGQTEAVKVVVSDAPVPVTNVKSASVSYNSINLSWDKSADAEGYNVYRSTSENGSYTLNGTTAETSFTSSKLSTGKTYYYQVRAYRTQNGKKVESLATPVSAKPVNAAPTDTKATVVSNGLRISWAKSTGASGYEVLRSDSKTGTFKSIGSVSGANVLNYTNTGLDIGKTYYYKVAAFRTMSSSKVMGDESAVFSGIPSCGKPTNLKGKGQNTSSILLTWDKPAGAKGYYVYRSTSKTGGFKNIKTISSSASAMSYTDTGLKPSTKYYYKIVPYITVDSSKIKGATAGPVAAQTKSDIPTGIKAAFTTGTEVAVSWNAVDGAVGYQVYRSTSATGPFAGVKTVTGTSFKDTSGISSANSYYYKVRSYRTVSSKKVYSQFSAVATAFREAEKPVYSIGVLGTTNNNCTYTLFSMTNKGTQDFVILANSGKLVHDPDNASGYDRNATMWVNSIKVTDKIVVKPGQQVKVQLTVTPATVYTATSHVLFDFTYDGRTYRNDCSNKGGSSFKTID